ncbi:hypothetical protein M0R45_020636 [Rubus argutus]|uniref:Uncharacterized protein n=1 Tax=Rubus argutus TaxID=59490 RepID=A0AAW1XAL5_RUBAR
MVSFLGNPFSLVSPVFSLSLSPKPFGLPLPAQITAVRPPPASWQVTFEPSPKSFGIQLENRGDGEDLFLAWVFIFWPNWPVKTHYPRNSAPPAPTKSMAGRRRNNDMNSATPVGFRSSFRPFPITF